MTVSAQQNPSPIDHEHPEDQENQGIEGYLRTFFQTNESLKEYSQEFIQHIQKKPLTALLVAGGIGFALSALLKHK